MASTYPKHLAISEHRNLGITFLALYAAWLAWRIINISLLLGLLPDGVNTALHLVLVGGMVTVEVVHAFFDMREGVTDIRRDAWVAVFACVATATFVCSGESFLLDMTVIVFGARRLPFKYIGWTTLIASAVTVLGVCACSQLGIVLDYIWIGNRIRHGLGFRFASYPSHFYLNVVLAWFLLRKKPSWAEVLTIFLVDFLIYELTYSRNSFLMVLLLVLASIARMQGWMPENGKMRAWSLLAAKWLFTVLAVASVAMTLWYSPADECATWLNNHLSGRLGYMQSSLFRYGIMPFGQHVEFAANGLTPEGTLTVETGTFDSNVIDNSYIKLLVVYGAASFCLALHMFWTIGAHAQRTNDMSLAFGLFVMMLHGFIDPQLLQVEYNVLLFMYGMIAYRESYSLWHGCNLRKV